MASSDYVSDLETKLATVDAHLARATELLDNEPVEDKVRSLAEIARLRQQHEALVKRIEEAKAEGADHWSTLHASFREEADALAETLESWLTRNT